MAWYSLIAGYPTKVHYFNYDDDLIMQNTESAICGPVGFGLDIEKISDPKALTTCVVNVAQSWLPVTAI